MRNKFNIRIADLDVEIQHYEAFVKRQCRYYLADGQGDPQITVHAQTEEIEKEWRESGEAFSKGYCESVCIYRNIAWSVLPFQAFLLHAAVIEMDGRGYAFTAPSGTGKSTHIRLWQEVFESRVRIINGDKPIVRLLDGKHYAYGTPWCGKENQGINDRTALSGLCFLERGLENRIRPAIQEEVADRLLHQVLLPSDRGGMNLLFDLLDHLLAEVPCYIMSCNMQPEAAKIACRAMKYNEED